eukprot:s2095_g16.t1
MMRGRPGSSSLVPDLAHLDLTLPARSFGSSDLPPLLRSLACMDSAFLLCGLSRFASSLLALDWAHLGLVALLQSFTWTGASVLVPDSLQSGFPTLLRSHARSGSASLACGAIKTDLTTSLLDPGLLDSLAFLQSPARPGAVVLALDLLHLGSSTFFHNMARSDAPFSTLDRVRFEVLLLVSDLVHSGFLLSPHSSARVGAAMLAPHCARIGPLSLLSDLAISDFSVPVRSLTHSDLAASAPDLLHPGPMLPAQSFSSFGSCLLLRMFACSGSAFSPCGMSCLESFLSVPDHTILGFALPTRSSVRTGPAPSALDFLHSGLTLSSRHTGRPGSAVPSSGLSWLDASILSSDFALLESFATVRSMTRPGLALSALDSLHLGSLLSLRSLG